MAADLRETQENQGFPENRIDKPEFVEDEMDSLRIISPNKC